MLHIITSIILVSLSIFIPSDSNSIINNPNLKNKTLGSSSLARITDQTPIISYADVDYDPIIREQINNIYLYMLADLAEQRDEIEIAKENLQDLLNKTQDHRLAQFLTELAINTEDYQLLLQSSKEWAFLEPENHNAQLIAVIILLDQEPNVIIEKLLNQAIQNNSVIDAQLFDIMSKLDKDQQKLLQQIMQNIVTKDPSNPIKHLCLANIQVQMNQIKAAESSIKQALNLNPHLTNAIIFQSKLIKHNTKSDQMALAYLKKQVNKLVRNEPLHIFYAHALFDNKLNQEALKILYPITMSKNKKNNLEANLLTAEIYMQPPTVDFKKAKHYLTELLNQNLINDQLYFLLGNIAEKTSDFAAAIKFYTLIEDKPYHFIGFLRAAVLLAENEQLNLAIDTLNQTNFDTNLEKKQLILLKTEFLIELQDLNTAIALIHDGLNTLPNDIDLLYAGSMVHGLNNQMDLAESNLRSIINIQPNHHVALHSLGFLLTFDNKRQKEALNYLEQALILSPKNPNYMYSIGVLLYHMGKIAESLTVLRNAYNISDSINIATHLGEVLWISGDHQQAKTIWEKAWKKQPDDLELIKTLNQFKIVFPLSN